MVLGLGRVVEVPREGVERGLCEGKGKKHRAV